MSKKQRLTVGQEYHRLVVGLAPSSAACTIAHRTAGMRRSGLVLVCPTRPARVRSAEEE